MTLEVLISCMHQKDHSIIERTNIQSDVVVINQCDENRREEFSFINKKCELCHAIFISTCERGLSNSRNMALKNATADICLICDDDEVFDDDYVDKINQAYTRHSQTELLAFQIRNTGKKYPKTSHRINFISALQLASWQLTFRRESIIGNKIIFDPALGSGVSKAGGEENMFLYNCLHKNLKIIYEPIAIGKMIEGSSQWFNGCNEDFFYDRGKMTRKLMGKLWATAYASYYLISKYHWYRKDLSFWRASKALLNGIYKKESYDQ